MNLSTYSMFSCATAIGCGDERWVIPMAFVFSRLIFSPTCALCSSSLVVIYWHTFSSSATIAMSSAKSKSVKRFRFSQTMPYSYLSIVMKRNGERMQPCRNPDTILKNSVYFQSWHSSWSCHTMPWRINKPIRNAVVCQNFLQGWPVYTVKCLFKIDEVNDEVLLMLEALFRVNISTYSMFPCATAIGCGDERWVIPMAFVWYTYLLVSLGIRFFPPPLSLCHQRSPNPLSGSASARRCRIPTCP